MNRQPIKSTNIRSAGFDDQAGEIEVEFHSGGVYRYSDCDANTWNAFTTFPSKGKYLNKFMKGKRTRKMDGQ